IRVVLVGAEAVQDASELVAGRLSADPVKALGGAQLEQETLALAGDCQRSLEARARVGRLLRRRLALEERFALQPMQLGLVEALTGLRGEVERVAQHLHRAGSVPVRQVRLGKQHAEPAGGDALSAATVFPESAAYGGEPLSDPSILDVPPPAHHRGRYPESEKTVLAGELECFVRERPRAQPVAQDGAY